MEISWDQIPNGIDWVAIDECGHMVAYQVKPFPDVDAKGRGIWAATGRIIYLHNYNQERADWRQLLFKRPTTKTHLYEATKHDQGKPRYDLLPADALDQIAQVFTFGAAKYADRNWESGMAWGRLFAALMRHAWAFWRGEELDPETGYHHLAHAGACVLMLLASVTRGAGTDDRGDKNG